ncbi:MAG: hypothetical protein ACYCX4_11085 [Bacillota bacterium]
MKRSARATAEASKVEPEKIRPGRVKLTLERAPEELAKKAENEQREKFDPFQSHKDLLQEIQSLRQRVAALEKGRSK